MSEDSRLRKLLAAALVELHRLDETVYQQARGRVEAFAPKRFAEILARHDDLYKPPEPAPVAAEEEAAQPAAADAGSEPAEPREAADPPAIRRRRPAAAAASRRRSLCRGYATAGVAGVRRRCRRKTDGGLCVFSTARPGTPARTTGERCVFCSPQRMLLATHQPLPLQNLKADLGKLERKAPWVHARAHERLQRHLPRSEYKKVLTPKHCCRGRGEDMCVFSCRVPGTPARVSELDAFCIWCDPDRLPAAQIRGAHGAATQLRFFREHCPEAYAKADQTLRDLFGDDYVVTYFATGRAREAVRAARRRGTADWTDALQKRKLRTQEPENEAAARRKYRKLLLDDRKKVQNSFFPGTAPRQDRGRGDAVPEEVGPPLPPADYSDLSRGLESWCLRGSWAMCKDCGSLQPRPLHEIDLAGDPKVDLPPKQCRRCSGNRDHYVPQPEDVPEALRGLSPAALAALSPLEVDVGPETRSTDAVGRWNGYRKKMKLITFLWAADSVKQRVKSLQDRAMRRKAKEAHRYLLASAESSYRRFHDLHAAFLAKHGTGTAERQRKRPYHFLQEVGLECAVCTGAQP